MYLITSTRLGITYTRDSCFKSYRKNFKSNRISFEAYSFFRIKIVQGLVCLKELFCPRKRYCNSALPFNSSFTLYSEYIKTILSQIKTNTMLANNRVTNTLNKALTKLAFNSFLIRFSTCIIIILHLCIFSGIFAKGTIFGLFKILILDRIKMFGFNSSISNIK